MSDIYCGIKVPPKGKKRGTAKECASKSQIRYYGLEEIDLDEVKYNIKELGKLDVKIAKLNIKLRKLYQEYKYEENQKKSDKLYKRLVKLKDQLLDLKEERKELKNKIESD